MPHLCSSGQVVYDPHGLMAELQAEARAIWNAGPPPISDQERWQFRYHVADFLRDLADVDPDPHRFYGKPCSLKLVERTGGHRENL
jgi:aminoglycoside phosphotransferase (APT) family kinase protein